MYTSIEKLLAALPRPETEGQSVMVYVAERRGTASSDPYDTAVFGNEADAIAWANRQKFERESKHYDEQVAVVDAYRHEAEYGDDELLRWDTNPTDATTVFSRDLPDTVSTPYQDFVEQLLGHFEGDAPDGSYLGAATRPAAAPQLRRVYEINYGEIVKLSTSLSDDAQ